MIVFPQSFQTLLYSATGSKNVIKNISSTLSRSLSLSLPLLDKHTYTHTPLLSVFPLEHYILIHSLSLSFSLALCSQSWQPQTPQASKVTGGGPNTCAHADDAAAHCLHTESRGAAASNDTATESHCVTPPKSGLLLEVLWHFSCELGSERRLTVRGKAHADLQNGKDFTGAEQISTVCCYRICQSF